MNYIIEFYKGLDTVNLIIFWGVIIVVLLLLIFSIILANKNRKLEKIIESNGINIDDNDYDELPIKKQKEPMIVEDKTNIKINNNFHTQEQSEKYLESEKNNTSNGSIKKEITEDIPIIEPMNDIQEEKFIAEEHVMEYNNNDILPKIEENNNQKEMIRNNNYQENIIMPGAYQKNVLREVYPSQTSPIGIIKKENKIEQEEKNAKELNDILKNNIPNSEIKERKELINDRNIDINNVDTNHVDKEKYKYHASPKVYQETYKRGNYLEELSKKLAENNNQNDINRTEYELKQEEEAIISYEELMQKKDSIKIVDEEDAIISIEELKKRKQEEEKLYNITEKENNSDFINELKNFRSDL